MDADSLRFQVQGHKKIIEHYQKLLEYSNDLPTRQRDELLVQVAEEERQLNLLLQKTRRGR